jgi:predicted esterase
MPTKIGQEAQDPDTAAAAARSGALTTRPREQPLVAGSGGGGADASAPGLHRLGLDGARDGLVYVPPGYGPDRPAPLVVMLHGAGGDARNVAPMLTAMADEHGFILLAPDSRGPTWDVILDDYGPDVAFLDRALERLFATFRIDPAHVAVAGFSDGASYALSLGVMNGGLFTHVIAFSPGFMAPKRQNGAPAIFVSHGVDDTVLPIERCSRRLVPRLEAAGYAVRYREFPAGHVIPNAIVEEAIRWFTTTRSGH